MTTTDENLIYVSDRKLPYSVFDADNHMYENRDALTKYLPKSYEGLIKYVEINGRTKLAIADKITNYIPNPTFGRVAVPGVYGLDVSKSHRGDRAGEQQAVPRGERVRAMPGLDAFFDPEPRLELMRDMGIDRTILWPTLASSLEERLAYDPDATIAAIHALNEWMHEHWTFNYADAIFSTPIISLAGGNGPAIEELETIAARGAKIFLIRVAPVPTWKGSKSFALPEFDPFWARVQELGLIVGMHAGDPGYTKYANEWEGVQYEANFGSVGTPAFLTLMSDKNALIDAMASIIGHGLATRFPDLKFMPTEYGSGWIRPFVEKLKTSYEKSPALFEEDPFERFRSSIYIHMFHEPDPQGLLDIGLQADHLMFGSDFPHPEGMADPLAYSEVVEDMPAGDQELIMGGTISRLMGYETAAA
jgi:predicted TIM-barrel fold metal-dependent hydrolase